MKRILTICIIAVCCITAGYAQKAKFGHVDYGAVMKEMPGIDTAQQVLVEYQQELEAVGKQMAEEFKTKHRAQDVLGGGAFRREIQFHVAIRRRLAGVFLGRGDRQLRLAGIAHIFDDRILLHLLAQFGGKVERSHLKHLQRLSHLRRQRLGLGETLRQVVSWTGHVENIIP